MPNVPKNPVGYVLMKKTAGGATPAVGTQLLIPVIATQPRNPLNNQYPQGVNKSMFTTNLIKGTKTPSIAFQSYLKTSYVTPAFLTSLIDSFDTNQDSDTWAIYLNDGTQSATWSNRIFDGCKCAAMQIAHSKAAGGTTIECAFLAQTASGSTSFTLTGLNPDAGEFFNSSQVDYGGLFNIDGSGLAGSTADFVRGWRLNLMHGQAYNMYSNGTLDPAAVSSGKYGGTVQLEQTPLYAISPSSSFVVRIGPSGSPAVTATCLVNLDEDVYDVAGGFGTLLRTYTLYDNSAGGNPCVFS